MMIDIIVVEVYIVAEEKKRDKIILLKKIRHNNGTVCLVIN